MKSPWQNMRKSKKKKKNKQNKNNITFLWCFFIVQKPDDI